MPDIKITACPKASVETVVKVEGDIDVYTSHILKEELLVLVGLHKALALDLSQVKYLDSTGLGVMIMIHKLARKGDKKCVAFWLIDTMPPDIRKIFKITKLDQMFSIRR